MWSLLCLRRNGQRPDQAAHETEQTPQAGDQVMVCVMNILAFVDTYFIFLTGHCALKCIYLNPLCSLHFVRMKFLKDCPIQPLIPLYLLVNGIIGALKVKYNYPLFVVLIEIYFTGTMELIL